MNLQEALFSIINSKLSQHCELYAAKLFALLIFKKKKSELLSQSILFINIVHSQWSC